MVRRFRASSRENKIVMWAGKYMKPRIFEFSEIILVKVISKIYILKFLRLNLKRYENMIN